MAFVTFVAFVITGFIVGMLQFILELTPAFDLGPYPSYLDLLTSLIVIAFDLQAFVLKGLGFTFPPDLPVQELNLASFHQFHSLALLGLGFPQLSRRWQLEHLLVEFQLVDLQFLIHRPFCLLKFKV